MNPTKYNINSLEACLLVPLATIMSNQGIWYFVLNPCLESVKLKNRQKDSLTAI